MINLTIEEGGIKLFKTIFDQNPISTQIFTPDGEIIFVNKAWEKLWNVKYKHVGSYNILKDKQLIASGSMHYIKRGFNGKIVYLPPIRYDPSKTVQINGQVPYRWISGHMYPIRDQKRNLAYVVLQHEDITERMEADEINARLAAIVASSDDAIISKTLDGNITSWNKSAEKLFGYTAKEALGEKITLIIPPERRKEEEDIINKLKKGKRIHHFHTVRITKHKQLIDVSLSISPIKGKNGAIIGASKIARDITNQKKSEELIRQNEERLKIALDAGKIGVWDWEIDNNTLTWTDNVYTIHDVSKKDFIVTFDNFKQLIHPDDRARVLQEIEKSLQNKTQFYIEFRIVPPSGTVRWVETQAVVTYDKNGKPTRMLGATTDITQHKQLEQEKSDFLSMASHELKTPITSMKMFVDLLYKELQKEKQEKPLYFTKRIKDQTYRLTELTNDLLDVSRIETGKLQLHKELFDLHELVQDTVEGLQATTNHTLLIQDRKKIFVSADRYRVYQVLVNLITNAIKYSPNNKKIKITLEKNDSQVIVGIKDYGIGIAKEKQTKIFDRLYQVSDPTEKTFPGLGLGLFISKDIVERHGGKIWLTSKKGKGSTFYFSLPINP